MTPSAYKLIPAGFTAVPSLEAWRAITVTAVETPDATLDAIGYVVGTGGDVPGALGLDRAALSRAGFTGKAGETLLVPTRDGAELIAVGSGDGTLTTSNLRDVAASFARAAKSSARIGVLVPGLDESTPAVDAAAAIIEGILLARYRFSALQSAPKDTALSAIEIALTGAPEDDVTAGIHRGVVTSRSAALARDLANAPPSHLTAADLAVIAARLGGEFGFDVESYDKEQLIEMRCGGLLGVNAGSAEEPRMIKLSYTPDASDANGRHVAFVGKGIMYDSGGISLKPSDPMHLLMKMDMGGAAAVLGAVSALRDLRSPTAVTAYLACTDNMPSGSAYKLGDVLTARNGTTIEVKNTDAEGRLVMSDALVLASEAGPDAIVDIATLTGAALMALGGATAALLGNDESVIEGVKAAGASSGESVWQLPLEKSYRKQLDSDIADISNLGGPHAGATTAALFLAEFVDGIPWAHLDIAGTMQSTTDDAWRSKGATGFGARLLIDFTMNYGSE
ncbi:MULTISPECIES: leucyl aminopeptidase [unclassified Leifsonia]|uniref:leucyl aminopeptidase n=1 Tax=unclassified Leifsonia TaxID=2663824 RepID=UPI0006F6B805|nr:MULTISPECIES: leucyl aminopeptidase [unclassified Leifsonia]KQX07273.1 leucyl aminopeptidase [Leifsonia sp. Root1293]KRA11556.1 leucyl aminopeptidase [Leifsonia sp. Root60]